MFPAQDLLVYLSLPASHPIIEFWSAINFQSICTAKGMEGKHQDPDLNLASVPLLQLPLFPYPTTWKSQCGIKVRVLDYACGHLL